MKKIKILGASSPYKWYNGKIGNIIEVDKIDSSGNACVLENEDPELMARVKCIVDKGDFAPVNNVKVHFNLMLPTMSFATKQFLKRLNADGIDETSIWDGYFDPTSKKYSVEVRTNGSVWELSDIDTLYIEIVLDQVKKQRIRVSNNPKNRFSYSYSDLAGMEFEAEIKQVFEKFALINHPRHKKPIMIYPEDYTIVNGDSKKETEQIKSSIFEQLDKTFASKLTAETMDRLTKMAKNTPFNPLLSRFMYNPKPISWADDYLIQNNLRYGKTLGAESFINDVFKIAPDANVMMSNFDISKPGSDFCAVTRCYIKDGKIVVEDVDFSKYKTTGKNISVKADYIKTGKIEDYNEALSKQADRVSRNTLSDYLAFRGMNINFKLKENPELEKFKKIDSRFVGICSNKGHEGKFIYRETPKEKPHYKFRGKFEAGKEYKKNDVVTYKNKNFICKHDVCHYMSFIDPDNILFGLWEKVVEDQKKEVAQDLTYKGEFVAFKEYSFNDVVKHYGYYFKLIAEKYKAVFPNAKRWVNISNYTPKEPVKDIKPKTDPLQDYNFKGKFDIHKNYKKNDVVLWGGVHWFCLKSIACKMYYPDSTPSIINKIWEMVENPHFSPKPPIGIVPAAVFYYRALRKRQEQIKKAIGRYKAAGLDIPVDWIAELNGHALRHTV